METKLKIILIFIVTITLATILVPEDITLYGSFFGYKGCSFWPCDQGSQIKGFAYFYILLLSFSSFLLLKKKTAWFTLIIGSIILWLIVIYAASKSLRFERMDYIATLVIMIASFMIGYGLAFGIRGPQKPT